MKRVLIILLTVLSLPAWTDAAPVFLFNTLYDQINQDVRDKIASDIVINLAKEDYEAVRKDFSGSLKNNLTGEKIGEVWETVIAQNGSFKKVVGTTTTIIQGYNIIRKRVEFENDNLTVEVTFNEENKVIGLFVKP